MFEDHDHVDNARARESQEDTEVSAKAERRQFSAAYKLHILQEAERGVRKVRRERSCVGKGCIRRT